MEISFCPVLSVTDLLQVARLVLEFNFIVFSSFQKLLMKEYLVRKGVAAQPLLPAQQPFLPPSLQPEPEEERGLVPSLCAVVRRPHDPAQAGTPGNTAKPGSCLSALSEQALNTQVVGKVLVCICR